MYRLSFVIAVVFWTNFVAGQDKNIHGEDLKVDCKACHNAKGWEVEIATISFDHETTSFVLEGQHAVTDCKACHETLVFSEAESDCASCHEDVHNMSVGNDCMRCHSSNNWLVDHIPELHEQNGFPLVGAHTMLSCVDCHLSETNLRWDRLGSDCDNCHLDTYNATTNPDHRASNFSIACDECHDALSLNWGAGSFHFFFALTEGHDIVDCNACHLNPNDYGSTSPDCASCHLDNYNNTTNPNHPGLGFSTNCALCHSTSLGWKPATFEDHDPIFPIYSGKHKGTWNSCTTCHLNPNDYKEQSCIVCHNDQADLDDEHNDVSNYVYESNACYTCHPTGDN